MHRKAPCVLGSWCIMLLPANGYGILPKITGPCYPIFKPKTNCTKTPFRRLDPSLSGIGKETTEER